MKVPFFPIRMLQLIKKSMSSELNQDINEKIDQCISELETSDCVKLSQNMFESRVKFNGKAKEIVRLVIKQSLRLELEEISEVLKKDKVLWGLRSDYDQWDKYDQGYLDALNKILDILYIKLKKQQ